MRVLPLVRVRCPRTGRPLRCLLPEFMIVFFKVTFQLGGTALLIVVVVAMDFMAQVQAHLMSHQYEGLLKKANLRRHGRRI